MRDYEFQSPTDREVLSDPGLAFESTRLGASFNPLLIGRSFRTYEPVEVVCNTCVSIPY